MTAALGLTGEIPMKTIIQECRKTAELVMTEVRRSGYVLTEEEACNLRMLIEKEILKAITAQKGAEALSIQVNDSLQSLQKFLIDVDSTSRS